MLVRTPCVGGAADSAGAPTPSPLEQAVARMQARRTLQSFGVLVGLLHFAPYLLHYVGDLFRKL